MELRGVVLDVCVLFPAALRDTLLRAAAAGLYRVRWSKPILEEVRRNLVDSGRTTELQAEWLLATMGEFFPEAAVTGFESLIDQMTNHPKDRHVLAAVAADARLIVSHNLRDFPRRALIPVGVAAQSPDVFLTRLLERRPGHMLEIISRQAHALRTPPMTVAEVLDDLALHAPRFAALVRQEIGAGGSGGHT